MTFDLSVSFDLLVYLGSLTFHLFIAPYLQYLVLAFREREEGFPVYREQEETSLTTLVQVRYVGLKVATEKYTNTSAIHLLYTPLLVIQQKIFI